MARQCYVTSVRKIKGDIIQLSELELELENRGRLAPVEELVEVKLKPVEDMPKIDLEVAVYRLNVNPRAKPVKQRKRQFAPEQREVIREEIAKLLNAQFIREVQYTDWLANVVLVKKANGKWRVYIDFTDLNKACSKDSYPLPWIDSLVDITSGHKLYSFLDAFSRYHQIPMATEDQKKTSFMADFAIYCYKVMPFGLKNAGATYQRLINKVFVDLIGKTIEAYVLIGKTIEAYIDDMVVKSKQVDDHITDLEEVFSTLRKYNMKLNPTKCAFGVASGKSLGFMITNIGIEANPDKIQALISMEAPKEQKGHPKAYRSAFQQLKQILAVPLVLAKPKPSDTLFLYLVVSRNTVSGVLVKEKGKVQQPIYYVSKVLLDTETRYNLVEQLALALIVTARKLRQYFQSHPIIVLTNQPLKHILQKPDVSGRKARNKKLEHDLKNLGDICRWDVKQLGLGGGIIIISPDKTTEVQCALRFEFEATNNESEYEAVVIALELARNLELENIRVFSDSRLVVGQIEGSFERKDEQMSLHCLKVHDLQRQFTSCEILKIARADNSKADALSRFVFTRIDGLNRTVHIKIVTEPSINTKLSVMDIDHEPSWIDPIVEYISNRDLPPDPRAVRSIRAKASTYCIIRGVLFRRSLILPYLRCLKPSESLQALTEVHEGICENHQGARALAYKLIRYGYYWPTIKKDAAEYVKRCDKYQRFGNAIHAPAEELTSIHYSAPFEQWGVDFLGPFPMARRQLKFVVVAVEYFTKTSHKTATGETPFMLAFVLEATIPIEVSLPTLRRVEPGMEDQTTEHLDLLEEVREQASLRAASYQNKTAKYFNTKVKSREFKSGDLVLRRAETAGHPRDKLGPVWEGPFEGSKEEHTALEILQKIHSQGLGMWIT
ncbi:uncharacterized protein LOC111406590 [Olea europaea var. sylvestris]|uniref:uncharacterized protein LOC111406590 n=1 Tax=Olea europaea var. sylvestris TaxID=158386 RepID=UPI000C1D0246|nr:uncharacterized protein LOC111406590 [Olea europaea var. sylvestris]